MAEIWMDVDTALSEVPVNVMPLIDDTDFKTIEDAVAYNAAGMALFWHFVTTAGAYTVTAVTPTTAGDYDWTDQGTAGIYTIEIPASGGASINNDTEGFGWFSGVCDGVLPWRGPVIGFRAAAINDALIDSAWSATRGLAGTALPNAAADAAGGLVISDAGGLDIDSRLDAAVSSRLAPTTAGRTLDVSTGGEAGIDWANVGSPTTTVAFTGTTIATTQKVDVETIKTNPCVNAGTVTFPQDGTIASRTNITAATGIVLSGVTHTGAVIPTVTTLAGHTAQTGDTYALANGAAGFVAIDTVVDAILADTNELQTDWANGGRLDVLLDICYDTASQMLGVGGDVGDEVRSFMGLGAADLDSQLTAIVGDTNELQTNQGAWATATGFSTHSAADVLTALGTGTWATSLATQASVNSLTRFFQIASGTIGTDNNTTQLHLPGLTFGDSELDNLLIVVYDVSTDEYHSNWINSWSAGSENTASLVLTLPFTPQASTDTYAVLSVRSNNKQMTAITAAIAALQDLSSSEAFTAVLTTQLTESYAADGAAPTLAQAIFLIQQALTEFAISGTTTTIKKLDGSTTAATLTLDDGTTPTSVTRTT